MADVPITDPLGRTILLHERTWIGHIVKAHPEMVPWRELVERAVRCPDQIRHSHSSPACRLYYGPGPRPTIRMMVVVDVELALVKTAHFCRRASGGPVEWSG